MRIDPDPGESEFDLIRPGYRRPRRRLAPTTPIQLAVSGASTGPTIATVRTMKSSDNLSVRRADLDDAAAVGQLLHDFNREYDEPTPPPAELAERIQQLLGFGDTVVLLAGAGPDGLAVLRFRPAIWSSSQECYLAELYVAPAERGHGLGRALMDAAMEAAREGHADRMDLGTSETDFVARRLYESLGFTNREGGGQGPVMYVYEREL